MEAELISLSQDGQQFCGECGWAFQGTPFPNDVHFDGGTRIGNCSAAAWYLESRVARDGYEYIFPLVMAGTFMQVPVSSFLVEAIGLEESTKYFLELLLQ